MTATADYCYGDLLDLVANDPRVADDFDRFLAAIPLAAQLDGRVSMNDMRGLLSNEHGLTIEPRRYSTFYRKAVSEGHLIRTAEFDVNDDHRGRNCHKPQRVYALPT